MVSAPPATNYMPYPAYQNGIYQGTQDPNQSQRNDEDVDSYYLNRNQNRGAKDATGDNGTDSTNDPALKRAMNDLRDAWQHNKLGPLAKHVQRDTRIAVYLRGKYQYSIDAGDYLDMTRDALGVTRTVRFELDKIERKQPGVYTVTGRHIYTANKGKTDLEESGEHTVHVTFVLQKVDNDYIITQVGSAPDNIDAGE